jgi:hypothetical protein
VCDAPCHGPDGGVGGVGVVGCGSDATSVRAEPHVVGEGAQVHRDFAVGGDVGGRGVAGEGCKLCMHRDGSHEREGALHLINGKGVWDGGRREGCRQGGRVGHAGWEDGSCKAGSCKAAGSDSILHNAQAHGTHMHVSKQCALCVHAVGVSSGGRGRGVCGRWGRGEKGERRKRLSRSEEQGNGMTEEGKKTGVMRTFGGKCYVVHASTVESGEFNQGGGYDIGPLTLAQTGFSRASEARVLT